ncbi:23S rRNA (guanosine(2251)-2'-O)-methyltransferase RlmB [Numidum massiliense]|uniref:23S rRNA (guanosine(2251)-2'-O)-methyltransferase RlmB n=1 Tax=Numidum massiliense TaxID=1522315 RepID=UPI0006D53FB1|nr:23S rRNA (guanosine(2251)-2'-O)-methyltransferase RlmB [Numidum massiliense]
MSEWIAGKNAVREALVATQPLEKIWLAEGVKQQGIAQIVQLAKERGIVVQRVKRQKLDQLTKGAVHQGVVATVAAWHYSELSEVLTRVQTRGEVPFLVVLDGVEDPHNLGSILRTADAAGVHAVIIPKRRAVGLTATVAKTSAGAVAHVPVVRVTNLARTIADLKQLGMWVTGAEAAAKQAYTDVDYTVPTVLVIGSEGKGISRLVRESCDHLVHLPLKGKVNSLNASVAAGLLMYEVLRKRA